MITVDQETILLKEVWVPNEKPFTFRESKDPTTGTQSFILSGLILPFGKVSRNNVLYNKESILEKHKDLIGRPVMYNHQLEGSNLPRGHYVDSYCVEQPDETHPIPGWYYKADIDPQERELIRKLQRGDLRHVSIQLVGGKVIERINPDNGAAYSEAFVSDVIEGSIVPAPGFLDTTAMFSEAFKKMKEGDSNIGAGPIIPDTQTGTKDVKSTTQQESSAAQQQTEEPKMPKMKENEADKDQQASASAAGAAGSAPKLDAKDVGQNTGSGMIAKENEANTDSQGATSTAGMSASGKLDDTAVGQDQTTEDRNKAGAKMESADADEDDLKTAEAGFKKAKQKLEEARKKEAAKCEEDEAESETERFREQYEDDMGKMTDIVEKLVEKVHKLEEALSTLKDAKPVKEAETGEEEEEPQPPMTESAKLRNVFTESVKTGEMDDEFNKSVRKVIFG